jgi:hypothetical protein
VENIEFHGLPDVQGPMTIQNMGIKRKRRASVKGKKKEKTSQKTKGCQD